MELVSGKMSNSYLGLGFHGSESLDRVFRVVTKCSPVAGYQCFGGTYRLHLHAFYGTLKYITVFTEHASKPYPEPDESSPLPQTLYIPSGFPTKILMHLSLQCVLHSPPISYSLILSL
jgi:hypothetical protein